MKSIRLIIVSILSLFLFSCGASQKVLNSWVNKEELKDKKYSKIFIAALSEDISARNIIENDIAMALKELGIESEKSIDVLSASFTQDKRPSKDDILKKVRETECDLIFTVSLLDSKSETRYVPGSVSYRPYPGFTYYRGFRQYYTYWAPTVYSPGYYTTDNSYYIEGNLFDAGSENILWSVQSVTYNPANIKVFSSSYCKLIVLQAQKDGLIK